MLSSRATAVLAAVTLAFASAIGVAACDLNPQPLPPGFAGNGSPEPGVGDTGDAAASGPSGGFGADAGGNHLGDAGPGAADASTDGGESDASPDGPPDGSPDDGAVDAPADAPVDANEEGG